MIVFLSATCVTPPTEEQKETMVDVGGEIVVYVVDALAGMVIEYIIDRYNIDLSPFYNSVRQIVLKLIKENTGHDLLSVDDIAGRVLSQTIGRGI
jgi:hypothetical protein